MEKVIRRQLLFMSPELREALMTMLMYKGKVAAMKLYKEQTAAHLFEAKEVVEKLAQEIEPDTA